MRNLLVFAILTLPVVCFAGDGSGITAGDGGHGVLCPARTKHPTLPQYRLELLDLYEARRLNRVEGTPIQVRSRVFRNNWYRSSEVCFALYEAKSKLSPALKTQQVLATFQRACSLAKRAIAEYAAPFTLDIGVIRVPVEKNCKIVQLGRYSKDQRGREYLVVNENLVQLLGSTDLSAFFFHEALHAKYPNEASTLKVREVVGNVFKNVR